MLLLLLLAAFGWGAVHALSPGHGKAMVAAYLVGTRGTPRQAVALGATVTVTHTAGVALLGVVALTLSQYVLPEDLYPWLNLVAGLLVLGVGAAVLRGRLARRRHHHHHHHHDHHHRRRATALGARARGDGRVGRADPVPVRARRPARRGRAAPDRARAAADRRVQRRARGDADRRSASRSCGRRARPAGCRCPDGRWRRCRRCRRSRSSGDRDRAHRCRRCRRSRDRVIRSRESCARKGRSAERERRRIRHRSRRMTVSHHADPRPRAVARRRARHAARPRPADLVRPPARPRGAVRRRRARSPPTRSPAGSTVGCPPRTSPPSTATSTRSRRSGWCGTCTSGTAPACTRWPAATTRATSRASAAAATWCSTGDALASIGEAVRAACGFDCAFAHFPIVGRCPDCSTYG